MSEIQIPESNNERIDESPNPTTYDVNLTIAESLEIMEEQDKSFRLHEQRWRKGGPFLVLAPLVTAGIIMATPLEHRMKETTKLDVDAAAIFGTLLLSPIPGYQSRENRRKGQELAKAALPVSLRLSRSTQPWIAKRLEEKEADDAARDLRRDMPRW
jgi:hypothetical protein